MYSAIKVNGKKLYEYARAGKEVEVKPREIEIYNIYLNQYNKQAREIIFTVECSKGTYIRTLCENIAQRLNTIGCMQDLERVQVGRFNIKDAIKINELKENKDNQNFINAHFISFEKILEDKPVVKLNDAEIRLYLNGVKIKRNLSDGIYRVQDNTGMFIGTGEVKSGVLKRDIVL